MGILEFILYMFITFTLGDVLITIAKTLGGLEKKIKNEYKESKNFKEDN